MNIRTPRATPLVLSFLIGLGPAEMARAGEVKSVFRANEQPLDDVQGSPLTDPQWVSVPSLGIVDAHGALQFDSPFSVPQDRGPLIADVFPHYSSLDFSLSEWGRGWSSRLKVVPTRDVGPVRYDGADLLVSPWGTLQRKPSGIYETIDTRGTVRASIKGSNLVVLAQRAQWTFNPATLGDGQVFEYVLREVVDNDGWFTVLDWDNIGGVRYLSKVRWGANKRDTATPLQYQLQFQYIDAPKEAVATSGRSGFLVPAKKLVSRVVVERRTLQGFVEAWHYDVSHADSDKDVYTFFNGSQQTLATRRRPLLTGISELSPSGAARREVTYRYDRDYFAKDGMLRRTGDGITFSKGAPGLIEHAAAVYRTAPAEVKRTYPSLEAFLRDVNPVDLDGDLSPELEYRVHTSGTPDPKGEYEYWVAQVGKPTQIYRDTSERLHEACRPHRAELGYDIERQFVRFAPIDPGRAAPQVVAFSPAGEQPGDIFVCTPRGELLQRLQLGMDGPFANLHPKQLRVGMRDWTRADTVFADVNGDSRPDIVRFMEGQMIVLPNISELNRLKFLDQAALVEVSELHASERHDIIDYNGDGIPDLIEYDGRGSIPLARIWLGTASFSRFPYPRFADAPFALELPVTSNEARGCAFQMLDVTGDRWADVLMTCGNGRVIVSPNVGPDVDNGRWAGPLWQIGVATRVVPQPNGLVLIPSDETTPTWVPLPLHYNALSEVTDSTGVIVRFGYQPPGSVEPRLGIAQTPALERISIEESVRSQVKRFFFAFEKPQAEASIPRFLGYGQLTIDSDLSGEPFMLAGAVTANLDGDGKVRHRTRFQIRNLRHGSLVTSVAESDTERKDQDEVPIGRGNYTAVNWESVGPPASQYFRVAGTSTLRCVLGSDWLCPPGSANDFTEVRYQDNAPWCPRQLIVDRGGFLNSTRARLTTTLSPGADVQLDDTCAVGKLTVAGNGPDDEASFSTKAEVTYTKGSVTEIAVLGGSERISTRFAYEKGRLKSVSEPDLTTTTFGYDVLGRLRSVQEPSGAGRTIEYDDGADAPSLITTKRGGKTSRLELRHDTFGRLERAWVQGLGGSEAAPDLSVAYLAGSFSAFSDGRPFNLPSFVTTKHRVHGGATRVEAFPLWSDGTVAGRASERDGGWLVHGFSRVTDRTLAEFGPVLLGRELNGAAQFGRETKLPKPKWSEATSLAFYAPGDLSALRADRVPGATPEAFAVTTYDVGPTQSDGIDAATVTSLGGSNILEASQTGQLLRLRTSSGAVIERSYDALGRPNRNGDADDGAAFKLDALGRLRERVSQRSKVTYEYFPNTMLLKSTIEAGPNAAVLRKASFSHENGRLKTLKIESPGAATVDYVYKYGALDSSNAGLLEEVDSTDFKETFEYDDAFRSVRSKFTAKTSKLTIIAERTLGRDGTVLSESSSASLNDSPLSDPLTKTVTLDANAVPRKVTFGSVQIGDITYKNGLLDTAMVTGGGFSGRAAWAFDRQTSTLLGVTLTDAAATSALEVRQTFGSNGLVQTESASWKSAAGTGSTQRAFTYDSGGRLRTVTSQQGNEAYTLDTASQVTRMSSALGNGEVTRSANTVAWKERRVEFDALGQSRTVGATPSLRAADGQLKSFGSAQYLSDDDGALRAVIDGDAPTVFLPGGRISRSDSWQRVTLGGLSLGVVRNGKFEPELSDFRGSPWVTTAGASQRTACGALHSAPHGSKADFAGGAWLSGPNVVRLGVREYDPVLCQFLTPDPLITPGLGRHTYAAGNPVALSDPTGFAPEATLRLEIGGISFPQEEPASIPVAAAESQAVGAFISAEPTDARVLDIAMGFVDSWPSPGFTSEFLRSGNVPAGYWFNTSAAGYARGQQLSMALSLASGSMSTVMQGLAKSAGPKAMAAHRTATAKLRGMREAFGETRLGQWLVGRYGKLELSHTVHLGMNHSAKHFRVPVPMQKLFRNRFPAVGLPPGLASGGFNLIPLPQELHRVYTVGHYAAQEYVWLPWFITNAGTLAMPDD